MSDLFSTCRLCSSSELYVSVFNKRMLDIIFSYLNFRRDAVFISSAKCVITGWIIVLFALYER